jgi:hypothetical protein
VDLLAGMAATLPVLAARSARATWLIVILPLALTLAVSLPLGILFQVWIAGVQIRRFSHWFAGRPEAADALNRVFDVYGWRARMAVSLFRIPLPADFQERVRREPSPISGIAELFGLTLLGLAFLAGMWLVVYLIIRATLR